MSRYNRYANQDPYWTTARYNSVAANGDPIRKGDRIFYYPNGRKAFVGQAAIEAAADFQSCAEDEAFMSQGQNEYHGSSGDGWND